MRNGDQAQRHAATRCPGTQAGPVHFLFENAGALRSVEDLLAAVKRLAGLGQLFFRGVGQPAEDLLPSIGRRQFFVGRSLIFDATAERDLLFQFRRHAYQHFGRVPSEWETLFLARHYGLPNRLLDWTLNPLVALYFAAFYENDEVILAGQPGATAKLDMDGVVWAIQKRAGTVELDAFTEVRAPLEIPGIKLVYPFNPTPRIAAQSGVFTLHGDPWTDLVREAGRDYQPADLDLARLIRWTVSSRDKPEIIVDLENLAVNSRTLFPDLEGLARGLWQTEVIRQCL